jgi:hypothetical protein
MYHGTNSLAKEKLPWVIRGLGNISSFWKVTSSTAQGVTRLFCPATNHNNGSQWLWLHPLFSDPPRAVGRRADGFGPRPEGLQPGHLSGRLSIGQLDFVLKGRGFSR